MTPEHLARFMAKVVFDKSGCWLWQSTRDRKGYGKFWTGKTQRLAHRESYMHFVGPIGKPQLDHLCRVPSCVNPAHLRPATNRENTLAPGSVSVGARALRVTHCPAGHPYDEENTMRLHTGERRCRACQREKQRTPEYRLAENARRRARRRRLTGEEE